MKKIINGLMYDTEKSELIFVQEDKNRKLYKTENGAYFTLYATGEIGVKSEDWVKMYLGENDVAKYIELFGEPENA